MGAAPGRRRPRVMTEGERAALVRIGRQLDRDIARLLAARYPRRPEVAERPERPGA